MKAFTRNAGSDKAKALAEKGIQIHEGLKIWRILAISDVCIGNMKDKEAVRAFLTGSDYVFLVTQFWENLNVAEEKEQVSQTCWKIIMRTHPS